MKSCASCGRKMEPRRNTNRQKDEPRYCSHACRRRRIRQVDRELENAIRDLLEGRSRGGSICPLEAARAVHPDEWRMLMEPARRAARRLVAAGTHEIVQSGAVVDPSTTKGPIRVRRRT